MQDLENSPIRRAIPVAGLEPQEIVRSLESVSQPFSQGQSSMPDMEKVVIESGPPIEPQERSFVNKIVGLDEAFAKVELEIQNCQREGSSGNMPEDLSEQEASEYREIRDSVKAERVRKAIADLELAISKVDSQETASPNEQLGVV